MKFFDGQAWLMQIILFLTLGLLVFPSKILPIIGIGLLLSGFLIFIARPVGVFLSLLFFKINFRNKLFISWVGLRGAVPIVFATYPLIAGVSKADMIFNLVFFISVTSVLLQGTALPLVAKWLRVIEPVNPKQEFAQETGTIKKFKSEMKEIEITPTAYAVGKRIVDLHFPKTAYIMTIKRAEQYVTPTGSTLIEPNDKLFVLAENENDLIDVYQSLDMNMNQ